MHTIRKTEKKRQKEQYIVEEMIRLYCRKNHSEGSIREEKYEDKQYEGKDDEERGINKKKEIEKGIEKANEGKDCEGELCIECRELLDYARQRSEKCPFMEEKSFCSNCKVHCYRPEKREAIRKVMRFSGPRMLFYHPLLAVWHLISSKREKKQG